MIVCTNVCNECTYACRHAEGCAMRVPKANAVLLAPVHQPRRCETRQKQQRRLVAAAAVVGMCGHRHCHHHCAHKQEGEEERGIAIVSV